MADTSRQTAYARWLKTRPRAVQQFAAAYPFLPGDTVAHGGETLWFMGYAEEADGRVGILVSQIDPARDYDGAVGSRQLICSDHFPMPAL